MFSDLLLLAFLILMSGVFSAFETALFSLNSFQKLQMRKRGGLGKKVSALYKNPQQVLTTVLLGNELVNVAISILAAGVAYLVLKDYGVRTVYLISISITTMVLLVFGEILPKNLAIKNPLGLSLALYIPYRFFSWITFPVRIFLEKISTFLVKVIGGDPTQTRRAILAEDLRSMVEMGHKTGGLMALERELFQNVLNLARLTVADVMVPRHQVITVDEKTGFSEILHVLDENRYSRIPVYQGSLNTVIGILYAKDIVKYRLNKDSEPLLKEMLRPCQELHSSENLDDVFQKFQTHHVHMGIVKNEAGEMIGLITMDDILRRFFPE